MKNEHEKPTSITIKAFQVDRIDLPAALRDNSPLFADVRLAFRFQAGELLQAIKEIDWRTDWLRFSGAGNYVFPVRQLHDLCKVFDKKAILQVAIQKSTPRLLLVENDPDLPSLTKINGVILGDDGTFLKNDYHYGDAKQPYYDHPEGDVIRTLLGDSTEAGHQADPWLKKAVRKPRDSGPGVEWQAYIHGNVSTDGYRLHYDPRLPAPEDPEDAQHVKMITYILDDTRKNCTDKQATLGTARLRAALKQVIKLSKDSGVLLTFGEKLEYLAANEDGVIRGEIQQGQAYTPHECEVKIAVNPKYLDDILSGFGESCILKTRGVKAAHCSPLHLTDGQREAMLMPMKLDAVMTEFCNLGAFQS